MNWSAINTMAATLQPGAVKLCEIARDAAIAGHFAAREYLHESGERKSEMHAMAGHVGAPHLPADVIAHHAIEKYLFSALPDRHFQVIGEEARCSLWTPVGGLVVTVDPVDGTGPAVDLGFGWSTVVFIHLLAGVGRWRLAGAAICDSSLRVTAITERGRSIVSTDVLSGAGSDVALRVKNAPVNDAVAMVGAKSSAREPWIEGAIRFDKSAVYNLGGTPSVWGLVKGRLAAAVNRSAVTPWDGIHILLASIAGAVVYAIQERKFVKQSEVARWFSTPPLEVEGDTQKSVPPCVVAVSTEIAEHLVRALPEVNERDPESVAARTPLD